MKSLKPLEDSHQPPKVTNNRPQWLKALRTIYNLKLWRIILILVLLTIALYATDFFTGRLPKEWLWLHSFPWQSLGGTSLGVVIIAFVYEWLVREETEEKLVEVLQQNLHIQEETISSQITKALIVDREVMRRLLSSDVVDDIIRTGLEIRLGDDELAKEAYDSLLSHLVTYERRLSNYRHKITMTTIKDEAASEDIRQKYYQAYIDLRYDTHLHSTTFLFTCVADIEEYNTLLREKEWELRWIMELTDEFPKVDRSAFDVEFVKIGGLDLKIRSEIINGRFVIIAENHALQSMLGKAVTIYYRYKVKLQKRGHLLMITVVYPTKNVTIEFDYAETDIHFVNVLDFFVSKTKPVIQYAPSRNFPHKIEVELNEWVLPKSGVLFGWVLRSEMTGDFLKLMSENPHQQGKTPKSDPENTNPH